MLIIIVVDVAHVKKRICGVEDDNANVAASDKATDGPTEEGARTLVTFLDTPGHAAFKSIRERGTMIADIIILMISAEDGVMKQTEEVINLWLKSGRSASSQYLLKDKDIADDLDERVPLIVAINKLDLVKPSAIEAIERRLLDFQVVPESLGGDIQCVPISAKTGRNVDRLVDAILAQAEVSLDLSTKGPQKGAFVDGVILESQKAQGKGHVTTILLKNGTLKVGDWIFGEDSRLPCKIKFIEDDSGRPVKSILSGMPCTISGWKTPASSVTSTPSCPINGEVLVGPFSDEKSLAAYLKESDTNSPASSGAPNVSTLTNEGPVMLKRRAALRLPRSDRDAYFKRRETTLLSYEPKCGTIPLILVADVQGSLEALNVIIQDLAKSTRKVNLDILASLIGGAVSDEILQTAKLTEACVIVFNTTLSSSASAFLAEQNIKVIQEKIIYHIEDQVKELMTEKLPKIWVDHVRGQAIVKQIFELNMKSNVPVALNDSRFPKNDAASNNQTSKTTIVAGGEVTAGTFMKNASQNSSNVSTFIRVSRNGKPLVSKNNDNGDDEQCIQLKIREMKHQKREVTMVNKPMEFGLILDDLSSGCNFRDLKPGDTLEFVSRELQADCPDW